MIDGERTECFDDPYPYDVLMDCKSGPSYELALLEASEMCARCRFRPRCFTENAGEPWVEPISRKLRARAKKEEQR